MGCWRIGLKYNTLPQNLSSVEELFSLICSLNFSLIERNNLLGYQTTFLFTIWQVIHFVVELPYDETRRWNRKTNQLNIINGFVWFNLTVELLFRLVTIISSLIFEPIVLKQSTRVVENKKTSYRANLQKNISI